MNATQLVLLPDSVEIAFLEFHHAHPDVYEALRELAFEYKQAGFDEVAIATLYEVLRHQRTFAGIRDAAGFSLNNNHRAPYARLLMANEPQLVGMFKLRKRRDEIAAGERAA